MKILAKSIIVSFLTFKSLLAHEGGSESLKAGQYQFGSSFEITSGDSTRVQGNVVEDEKKATYQYYTISNAFGFTDNVILGLNLNYARAIYKASQNFPSSNETFVGHHEVYNEVYHKWKHDFGGHFNLEVKNSFLDIARSRRNSDLSYKMYQLALTLNHELHYLGMSYAKGLANKSLQGHNVDIMHLFGGFSIEITQGLKFNLEGEMEFEFMKASDIRGHEHYDTNAFLFNQSYKPKVAQSSLRTSLSREFSHGLEANLGLRYDLGGKETRNEKGIFLGFKKTI